MITKKKQRKSLLIVVNLSVNINSNSHITILCKENQKPLATCTTSQRKSVQVRLGHMTAKGSWVRVERKDLEVIHLCPLLTGKWESIHKVILHIRTYENIFRIGFLYFIGKYFSQENLIYLYNIYINERHSYSLYNL